MGRKTAALIFILCFPAWAEVPGAAASQRSAILKRDCPVFKKPATNSGRTCEKKNGDKLQVFAKAIPNGKIRFLRVISNSCSGFIPLACVKVSKKAVNPSRLPTASQNEEEPAVNRYKPPPRLSLGLNFDAITATVPYDSESSRGLGYSALLRFILPLNRVMRVSMGGGYQVYRLAHDLDLDGATSGASQDSVRQTIGYGTALTYLAFRIVDGKQGETEKKKFGGFDKGVKSSAGSTNFWLEGGVEGLFPLHSTQSGSVSVEGAIRDKALLAVGGISADFPRWGWVGMEVYGQIVFNLAGTASSRFYGLRLGVAIQSSL